MLTEYELRQQLDPAHSDDVKAVLAISDDCIASGSRDGIVGIWKLAESGPSEFKLKALLGGHGAYVNSLAHIPAPDGDFIASGGNSSMILLHSLDTLDPDSTHALLGHALNVCTLAYSRQRRRLISGSWDKTARVWGDRRAASTTSPTPPAPDPSQAETEPETGEEIGWEREVVLEGHDEAVWGVAIVDEGPKEGCYLTGKSLPLPSCEPLTRDAGSADRLINLWDETGDCLLRIKGSPEPVRSLSMFPGGDTFASACNDGLIRVWDMTGSTVKVFWGHTDYVYDVVTRWQQVLSCGEDHTARVWQDDGSNTTMLHPCQTVWSVDSLPIGDIVTGGSDGRVRIWTSDKGRLAPHAIRTAYDAEVQVAMKGSAGTQSTTDAHPRQPEGGGQAMTIDIDISDDAPPIPLTFTPGDDLAEVAKQFGQDHSLSDSYVRQITEFIELHLGQIKLEITKSDDKKEKPPP